MLRRRRHGIDERIGRLGRNGRNGLDRLDVSHRGRRRQRVQYRRRRDYRRQRRFGEHRSGRRRQLRWHATGDRPRFFRPTTPISRPSSAARKASSRTISAPTGSPFTMAIRPRRRPPVRPTSTSGIATCPASTSPSRSRSCSRPLATGSTPTTTRITSPSTTRGSGTRGTRTTSTSRPRSTPSSNTRVVRCSSSTGMTTSSPSSTRSSSSTSGRSRAGGRLGRSRRGRGQHRDHRRKILPSRYVRRRAPHLGVPLPHRDHHQLLHAAAPAAVIESGAPGGQVGRFTSQQ